MREIRRELEELLTRQSTDNLVIFNWIDTNVSSTQTLSSSFIRALMSVICDSILLEQNGSYVVQQNLFKQRCPLLTKYMTAEDVELQALYALQESMHQLQHPPNVLHELFTVLHDEDVVSEATFYRWKSSVDPSEQLGRGVALSSVSHFFTWLKDDS
jgi:translation initiation factor 4G